MRIAWVAQLVERRIENAEVSGSTPGPSTNSSVAQLVERLTVTQVVGGSIPSRGANES